MEQVEMALSTKAPKLSPATRRVLSVLENGWMSAAEFYRQCHLQGVMNPRAEVSRLRQKGYVIDASDKHYELKEYPR